jgi:cytochrome c oxidase assembly factor CtaG
MTADAVPVVALTVPWRSSDWTFEPSVIVPLVIAAAAYVGAARVVTRRRAARSWTGRLACFLAGIGVLVVALVSPIDAIADERFSVHMVQHLLLTLVAPPLLLFARPLTLAVAASSGRARSAITGLATSRMGRSLASPAFGFASFSLLLWISHLSPLYSAALTNDAVHALEHVGYVTTAMAFWWPVVAKDPGAARLSHPGRVLYVFLSMPVMSLLGFVLTSSDRVLYAPYVHAAGSVAAALADQRLGGTLMWVASMLTGTVALSAVLLEWMRFDDIQARRADAARERAPRGSIEAQRG